MALIAYSLCKDLRRSTDDKVQATLNKKRMNDWSSLANETFYQCSVRSNDTSFALLFIELPYWENESCFEIAMHSHNKDFIRHSACQNVLDNFWNRGINKDVESDEPEDSRCIWVLKLLSYFTIVAPIVSLFYPCYGKEISFLNVPKNKFIYNLISFAVFLTMFAYVLLFDLATNVSTLEYVLLAWVLTFLAEEIRQMASDISTYFKNAWNVLDVGTIFVFIVGFGLRFKQFPESFDVPKVVLAVDFVAFVFRLTHVFSINRVLGPKLLMIRRMVKDLMYFLIILAVFFVSYAIASHSVLYPVSPPTWDTVRQVLRRPYWHLYGELFLDETEGQSTCSENATIWTAKDMPRCPSETGKIVVPIMMGFYMLFVNILLLNLLIAIFSHSFAKIQVQSEKIWKYQRYFVIKEYVSRHVYYPPLNVIWMVITIIQCCVEKRNVFKNSRQFRAYVNVRASQIQTLEAYAVKACDKSRKDNVDEKKQTTHEMYDIHALFLNCMV
ncbi:transient receptor potential cation channel subfamily M member-like 2 [Dreissena polymorpha]|uniref:transient receptor potential cation channel subfamily M member-like 2 n=1 Tax=Dreissena polymorpha TaxID=45954 RepID=UPI002263B2EF|nr:transient receptor potential cation channel subfamily M member-like 2 [Dreissena polymorpha]